MCEHVILVSYAPKFMGRWQKCIQWEGCEQTREQVHFQVHGEGAGT